MKKRIKKLFYSSVVTFMSIAMNFDAEARVTKEVAEAALPYLMEAVGIPQDTRPSPDPNPNIPYYSQNKRDAIIRMIYTDEGQQQMVDWVVNDTQPPILSDVGAPFNAVWPQISSNVIRNPNAQQNKQERIFTSLFPCRTGTFSSFAANLSRLGYHALNDNGANLASVCSALINGALQVQNNREAQKIINLLRQYQNIGNQLAYVLFVLDICDTVDQIKDILNLILPTDAKRDGNIDAIIASAILVNEYSYRPVSATTFPKASQGDCVETLYRHLVNIAVQNDVTDSRKFNVEHLPQTLQTYYTSQYGSINSHVVSIPRTHTEAGKTELDKHERWKDGLSNITLPQGTDISNATIDNIVNVLRSVSPVQGTLINFGQSSLGLRNPADLDQNFAPTIQSSPAQGANATKIQDALNGIDGRCNNNNFRFIVNVTDILQGTQIQANLQNNRADIIIEITDRLQKRHITIGIWNNKHAEIIEIQ